ncbi:cytochrome c oxidase subunit 6, mitochondrial [Fusarium verticillioides 7600]|uniref:Cytochrome c oxidase subunit 6, mitochondrial n=1 Tax=Gibberella moniliformis (strain M3125 / FGSC 7600) TaxID=334819 RepID=W7M8Q0_GIBM7|nr:cytochrome c oxidase subunit 6, mitochondrial [Fusarium verticillioides 7600]EWG47938.1 cytochrome c oxidase subunit 6, mitochondrial [Fusarium verticillioides 7600]
MSAFIRVARSVRAAPIRPAVQPLVARSAVAHFTTSIPRRSEHAEETFEEFSARFEKEFDGVQDVFELQRNLNNAFAYDLVPAPSVIAAALKAARRVNDFGTAVRIFEGTKFCQSIAPCCRPLDRWICGVSTTLLEFCQRSGSNSIWTALAEYHRRIAREFPNLATLLTVVL